MWPEKKRRFNFLFRFFSTFSFDVLLLSKKREKRTDFFTQIFEKREKKREKKKGGQKTKFSSANQNSQRLTISSLLSKTVFKNNTYTKWPRLQRNPRRR